MSMSVQEMAKNGREPPGRYCYRDGVVADLSICSLPLMDVPVIDVGALTSLSSSKQELEKLNSALTTFGCFMSINHGFSSTFLEKMISDSKQFLALPPEEKLKYGRENGSIEGYGNDPILSENQVLDWNDRLLLIVSPEEKRQLKFWPEYPASFRETLSEYTKKVELLTEIILKAMAMSLNLEDDCFLSRCGTHPMIRSRFNFYPSCSRYHQVLGLKPHSDSGVITILLQDKEVEGLQILKDGQWFRVPIMPEALLINLGEQAELMSNGLFKAPVHRVTVNPEKSRFSQAVAYHPDPDEYIEPLRELVNETRPKGYKKVKNYFSNFVRNYQQGKRFIDSLKI